jgi:general secretion pathway protein F
MPAFRYTALDAAGHTLRGTMEAPDAASVVERLQRQGQIPMRAEPAGRRNFLGELLTAEFGRGQAMGREDVANVTRELATMLAAGQDLDRALRFVVETAPNPRIRLVMDRVRGKVRGGSALAAALAQEPGSFTRLYVGLVRAGEAGGTLGETLAHVAGMLDRQRRLAASVRSALIYPATLAIVAIGSIIFLLTWVLPEFVPIFEEAGAQLPLVTRMVIALGDFVTTAGPWLAMVMLVATLAGARLAQRPAVRLRIDGAILRLPVAGRLTREVLAARFCRTLGTLLSNGVPLITALGIVKDAVGNLVAVAAVETATLSAKGGAGLSRPLGESKVFPARTIHLLRLGEETARLGPMALRAADIHEEETRLGLERLVSLLVPAIVIVMGGAIATIMASLLMAMLSINDLAG